MAINPGSDVYQGRQIIAMITVLKVTINLIEIDKVGTVERRKPPRKKPTDYRCAWDQSVQMHKFVEAAKQTMRDISMNFCQRVGMAVISFCRIRHGSEMMRPE